MRRTFLLSFAAFFLLAAAWAFALPVNGTYDEKHHIIRAYAVVHGEWLSAKPASDGTTYGSEGYEVPSTLIPGNVDCARGRGPASCQTTRPGSSSEAPGPSVGAKPKSGMVLLPTAAARYSPVYYLPVGLPLLVSPDRTGILFSRLISAALSALLLAAAAAGAVALRSRLLLAGVALVGTPMAMNLNGSVNPNGLEIAAGVLVFVGVTALLRGVIGRPLLVATGIAAFLMLTVRQLGPVLLAVDVAACALVAGRARVAAALRTPGIRPVLGGFVAAGVAFVAAWSLLSPADTAPIVGRGKDGNIWARIATERVPFYVKQVVGQFGYGETTISKAAIAAWFALFLVVIVPALVRGGWRLRLALAGLAGFCLAMLVALDAYFAPRSGWFAHGRYALPTAVGIVLLAALAWRPRSWLPVALVVATAPIQLYALARVMTRYQVGIDAGMDPFGGTWRPVGGPVTPLVVLVAGIVALVTMIVTYRDVVTRPVTFPEPTDNGIVTPNGQSARGATKASTTDATSL